MSLEKDNNSSPNHQLDPYGFLRYFWGFILSYSVKFALGSENWLRFRNAWEKVKYSNFDPEDNRFKSILIQTITGCNLSCPFCPANKQGNRNYGLAASGEKMELTTYKKIVDDLAEIDYSGIIRPCLMNEPLLDNRLTELIRYADMQLPNAWIQIESNGELINESLVKALFEAGLDEAILNNYPTNRNVAKDIARMNTDTDVYFLPPLYIPWKEHKRKEKRIFVVSRQYDENLSNRAGNVPQYKAPLRKRLELFCDQPFLYMYIGFNGKAVLCCNDWGFEEILGNVKTTSILDIWTGTRYQEIRQRLLKGDRRGLCSKCDNTPRGPGKGIPGGISSFVSSLRHIYKNNPQ